MRAEERHYYSTARMRVVKSWVASSTNTCIVGTRSGLVRSTSRCEQAFDCDGNKVKIN